MKKMNHLSTQLKRGLHAHENIPEELKDFVNYIASCLGDKKNFSPLDLIHLIDNLFEGTTSKVAFPLELIEKKSLIKENLGYMVNVVETFDDKYFSDKFRELFITVFGASTLKFY